MAGDIAERFAAFGLAVEEVDSTDVLEIDAVAAAQIESRPSTARASWPDHTPIGSATTPRTTTTGRPRRSQRAGRLDPLVIHGRRLADDVRTRIDAEVEDALREIVARARAPDDLRESWAPHCTTASRPIRGSSCWARTSLDPYGGAFKVTRGLTTAFPRAGAARRRSARARSPGLSAGLALAGYRPIAEIMFGDFLALCFDQIVNHIAKYGAMYDGRVTCPVIIRTPSGGGRG